MEKIFIEKSKFIGQCGLRMQDNNGESTYNIRYLFNKIFWNKG